MGVHVSAADDVEAEPPTRQPLTPGQRRQRRAVITLMSVTALMLIAFLFAGAYYEGWFDNGTAAAGAPDCGPGTKATVAPSQVKLNVYNATQRQGLAKTVAESMHNRGFTIGTIANDPLKARITISADVRYGPKGKAAATLVAGEIPGAKIVADKRKDATVDLVLGNAYKSLRVQSASTSPSSGPTCAPSSTGTKTSHPGTTGTAHPTASATKKS
jgi:hypothetical protein